MRIFDSVCRPISCRGSTAGFAVLENERPWFAGLLFLLTTAASVGAIAVIVVWVIWLVRKSDSGPNKYGPDPRQHASQ